MNITPQTESLLIEIIDRGYWLAVSGDKVQLISTVASPGLITDAQRLQIGRCKPELLEIIPALESESVVLTESVVRVLYELMSPVDQERARHMRDHGNRERENARFYRDHANLSRAERVVYLWAFLYGTPANVVRMKAVLA